MRRGLGPCKDAAGQLEPGEEFFAQEPPSEEFLDLWLAKSLEVVDKYRPDVLWFDFGLGRVQEHYRREFLAHGENRCSWKSGRRRLSNSPVEERTMAGRSSAYE